eukprot:COSAG01_NODE_769_length_13735_cov_41.389410_9_plen_324_part_00
MRQGEGPAVEVDLGTVPDDVFLARMSEVLSVAHSAREQRWRSRQPTSTPVTRQIVHLGEQLAPGASRRRARRVSSSSPPLSPSSSVTVPAELLTLGALSSVATRACSGEEEKVETGRVAAAVPTPPDGSREQGARRDLPRLNAVGLPALWGTVAPADAGWWLGREPLRTRRDIQQLTLQRRPDPRDWAAMGSGRPVAHHHPESPGGAPSSPRLAPVSDGLIELIERVGRNDPTLRVVAWGKRAVDDRALAALAVALRRNTHIHTIDLRGNRDLSGASWDFLEATMATCRVEKVLVGGCAVRRHDTCAPPGHRHCLPPHRHTGG